MNNTQQKPIHLALQGGGAHGAFTWGVLDYLLEDGRLKIEAISGTSAGALNAAVIASHYVRGDIDQARKALAQFWYAMSLYGVFSPYNFSGVSPWVNHWANTFSWWQSFFHTSPYQDTVYTSHFLEHLLSKHVDFTQLDYDCSGMRLFVSATNVLNNRLHIFSNDEISIDVLLASSCLPKLHRAVEISGDFFWDGGFMGNPVLEPLIKDGGANDILIVQVNPLHVPQVPKSPMEINERMEVIGFNATLSREIRHIAQIEKLMNDEGLSFGSTVSKYMHLLHNENVMAKYNAFTKYDTSWIFLNKLKSIGREAAREWLSLHYDDIGMKNTIDLEEWEPSYQQPQCRIN